MFLNIYTVYIYIYKVAHSTTVEPTLFLASPIFVCRVYHPTTLHLLIISSTIFKV